MSSSVDPAASVMDRVDSLRQQLSGLVTLGDDDLPTISWQCPELDQFMPGGQLQPGMIVELLYSLRGSSAGSLAMHCAKQAVVQQCAPLVVVDRLCQFYPPAAIARGIESNDLIVVRPSAPTSPGNHATMSSAEELWALDQALRCPGVAVVMAWLDKIDPNAYRRLQLAAEAGQTLALFIRPEKVKAFATWADVQLQIEPQSRPIPTKSIPATFHENRFCRATLLRQRGRSGSNTIEGASVDLEIDEIQGTLKMNAGNVNRNEARTMHMAPRVAHPTARRRSAGA